MGQSFPRAAAQLGAVLLLWSAAILTPASQAQSRPSAASPSAPPASVVDYFLALPQRYFEITRSEQEDSLLGKNRGDHLVIDTKNDYLYFPGDGAQPPLTVALFRSHGRVTVAVLDGGYDPAVPTLDFLRFSHGRWLNVTQSVLPLPFDNRSTYVLPRHGTTILVRSSRGTPVYSLHWRNENFVVEKA